MSRNERTEAIRKAMKVLRSENPRIAKCMKVINHPYCGHVVWRTDGESRPMMTVEELLSRYGNG